MPTRLFRRLRPQRHSPMAVTATIAAGAASLALATTGCAPYPTNYNQWNRPASVAEVSSVYPAAIPTTYPGHDPNQRQATDYMLPGGAHSAAVTRAGWVMAHYAQANAVRLHVHYLCYKQSIWNIQRASEGWRPMPNRGSWTANHGDHLHISWN